SRNPYLYLLIALADGDFLYFPRISKGSGYADAVYQHSEMASPFYKAFIRWDGTGWETTLADASTIHFPESYNAKNMAQGAPAEMPPSSGDRPRLIRDPQRTLREIRGPGGPRITFAHDELARIVRMEDDQGHYVNYRYNPAGMLAEVIHGDGRARRYTYE